MQHPDVFEFVYLAKDSSRLYGVNNTEVRFDLGFSSARELHEKHPDWEFDRVVGGEIDEYLGWDGKTKTGSYIIYERER